MAGYGLAHVLCSFAQQRHYKIPRPWMLCQKHVVIKLKDYREKDMHKESDLNFRVFLCSNASYPLQSAQFGTLL